MAGQDETDVKAADRNIDSDQSALGLGSIRSNNRANDVQNTITCVCVNAAGRFISAVPAQQLPNPRLPNVGPARFDGFTGGRADCGLIICDACHIEDPPALLAKDMVVLAIVGRPPFGGGSVPFLPQARHRFFHRDIAAHQCRASIGTNHHDLSYRQQLAPGN